MYSVFFAHIFVLLRFYNHFLSRKVFFIFNLCHLIKLFFSIQFRHAPELLMIIEDNIAFCTKNLFFIRYRPGGKESLSYNCLPKNTFVFYRFNNIFRREYNKYYNSINEDSRLSQLIVVFQIFSTILLHNHNH